MTALLRRQGGHSQEGLHFVRQGGHWQGQNLNDVLSSDLAPAFMHQQSDASLRTPSCRRSEAAISAKPPSSPSPLLRPAPATNR
jgi:hypothetical protein